MDAFQVKCLRRVLKIAPSYYSRATKESVLRRAKATKMSGLILEKQLLLMGKLAIRRNGDILKQSVFDVLASVYKPKRAMGNRR